MFIYKTMCNVIYRLRYFLGNTRRRDVGADDSSPIIYFTKVAPHESSKSITAILCLATANLSGLSPSLLT